MRLSSLSKQQKICIVIFCIAFLVFITGGILLLTMEEPISPQYGHIGIEEPSESLADGIKYYPDKIALNQPMEEFVFYDKEGNRTELREYRGKNLLIIFWSSWCKYCNEELEQLSEYEELLKEYDDVEILLLNKLDGEKETIEMAEDYLESNEIRTKNYYDVDLKIYKALGLKVIPTLLGINKEGILKICYPDVIKGTEQMSAFIDYIRDGGSHATEQFVKENLTGNLGGIHVNYMKSEDDAPSGHDVLSESQGIMMEYAVITDNKELFEQSLDYVLKYMMNKDALSGWMVTDASTKRSKKSPVNSVIDDLRIYRALDSANQLWGGYEELTVQWQNAIVKYNTSKGHLIDFYDFKAKKKADRLTLCFADLTALQGITQGDTSSQLYKNTYQVLSGGLISNEFPLYYSWYDYVEKRYSEDTLNMAEGMMTLYNLAKTGDLKEETLQWIKNTIKDGGIKARYTISGEVVEGYNYESTAIYATLMMVALEIQDSELLTQAQVRMEWMRVNDNGSIFNGSFGIGDGTDIYSYDQCMALLAYGYAEQ